MSRVKIIIPQKLCGTYLIPVRITDLNYGNHIGNDSIVSLIHEARVQFLHQYGYTELNVGGVSLIMGDLQVEFKKEGFYGDIFSISVYSGEVTRAGFELFYKIETIRSNETILIALAKTGLVCFDYVERKVKPLPEEFQKILA